MPGRLIGGGKTLCINKIAKESADSSRTEESIGISDVVAIAMALLFFIKLENVYIMDSQNIFVKNKAVITIEVLKLCNNILGVKISNCC